MMNKSGQGGIADTLAGKSTLSALKEQIIRTIFLRFVLKNINALVLRVYTYNIYMSTLGGINYHVIYR